MEYLKALRPVMGIFSSLLCLAAFRLQAPTFFQVNPTQVVVLLIAVFCGTSATMVYNDFVDREHDLRKGKCHAYESKYAYADLAKRLYVVCAFCSAFSGSGISLGVICFCMVLGIYYSSTYRVRHLSMVTVGICSASPTLFALFVPSPRSIGLGVTLFLGVFVTICARETLKDIEDAEIDRGYKATIPAIWGISVGRKVAASILLGGSVPLLLLTKDTPPLVLLPLFMVVSGIVTITAKQPEKWGKLAIDLGTICLLIALLFAPMGPD